MTQLFRRIRRNPASFIISQFSLVFGIISCLIIFSFISFHKSYDSFYSNANQIYRVLRSENSNRTIALTEGTIKGKLRTNHTDLSVTHFMKMPVDITFELDKHAITEQNGILADQAFFSVFYFDPVLGKPSDFLSQPNSLVLTRSVAEKLFDDLQSGIGESISVQMGPGKVPLTVSGIIEDIPSNSGMEFSYIVSGSSSPFWNDESAWPVFNTFMKVDKANDLLAIDAYLKSDKEEGISYKFQSLTEIHLSDGIEFDYFGKFDKKYLTILTSIGALILLITLFNFFNFFYSQALNRIREITTRKVLGSSNFWVFKYLYKEMGFALLLSVLLSLLILFVLNDKLVFLFDFSPFKYFDSLNLVGIIIASLFLSMIFVMLISKHIHSYNLQKGLKGKISLERGSFNIGKLLLTAQLIIAFFSITFSLFISEQTDFLKNIDVGYTYQNIVTLKRPDNVGFSKWKTLQQNLKQQAPVQSIGLAVFPSIGEYNSTRIKNRQTGENHRLYWIGVDHQYIPTMEIGLVNGRNFDSDLQSDEQAIIINEKALALINDENYLDNEFLFRRKAFRIIGVVHDFNHHSLREEVQPMMMTLNNPIAFRNMTIRYSGLSQAEMYELINRECKKLNIASNLSMAFMEDDYNEKLLAEENVLSTISKIFSLVVIVISLIGLLGYFNFIIHQKKKEFSLRRVLGASLLDNFKSMVKLLIIAVLLSMLIAIPSAAYVLSEWKSQFIYQINLSFFHLLLPTAIVFLLILVITVSFSLRTQRQNPVTFLKEE